MHTELQMYLMIKCTKILTYTVSWTNLTGIPTGAHIHGTAARGLNAGIKHEDVCSPQFLKMRDSVAKPG